MLGMVFSCVSVYSLFSDLSFVTIARVHSPIRNSRSALLVVEKRDLWNKTYRVKNMIKKKIVLLLNPKPQFEPQASKATTSPSFSPRQQQKGRQRQKRSIHSLLHSIYRGGISFPTRQRAQINKGFAHLDPSLSFHPYSR